MSDLRLRTASLTHPGLVRRSNEDALAVREPDGVWLVADGMGGHANGAWASAAIAEAIGDAPIPQDFEGGVAALTEALRTVNTRIHTASTADGARMGSTAALLRLQDARFACLWVGDSRIYLLRDGRLGRLTRDHTQVQDMVERGLLTPEEARRHPMAHLLSRAVGAEATLVVDRVDGAVKPNDVFLVCSDGLSSVADDAEIGVRLADASVEAACERLLELVLSRGAPDNVTMAVVRCEAVGG